MGVELVRDLHGKYVPHLPLVPTRLDRRMTRHMTEDSESWVKYFGSILQMAVTGGYGRGVVEDMYKRNRACAGISA